MPDWTKSMQQTFEYFIVDPETWGDMEPITTILSSTIERDSEKETKGSASLVIADDIPECYIRAYLVTVQNGIRERFPLGTILAQTPSSSFDGKTKKSNLDGYTPLIELKEGNPPFGYTIRKDQPIMDHVIKLTRNHLRAPVVEAGGFANTDKLQFNFTANFDDTWSTFLIDLMAQAKYEYDVDPMGRILFAPMFSNPTAPVWEFNDGNSSILYPDMDKERDIYGIPNVIEVVYSANNKHYEIRVENNNPMSPTSTVSRGREILYREVNPSFQGEPSSHQIEQYAKSLMKKLSSLTYTVTYRHGYCPVRVGDCVLLNYERAGLVNINAHVIRQSIECTNGCMVEETATYTESMYYD